jgi:hypothetical protein
MSMIFIENQLSATGWIIMNRLVSLAQILDQPIAARSSIHNSRTTSGSSGFYTSHLQLEQAVALNL